MTIKDKGNFRFSKIMYTAVTHCPPVVEPAETTLSV